MQNALELKGEYCGSTAPKVKAAIEDAMGGCLFLDEAYALAGGDTFSKEAIRTLLTEVENNRTGLLVVLAGYKDKMGKLMRADPGLPRRFPRTISLADYTPKQVAEIAAKAAGPRFGLAFADPESLVKKLERRIADEHAADIPKQNGGLAINLLEQAVNRRLQRLMRDGGGALADELLIAEDFGIVETPVVAVAELKDAVDAEIDALIGCDQAKDFIKDIKAKVAYVEAGGNPVVLRTCLNVVITGNPGTGKTTFSRLLFRFLHAYGVLPKDIFVEKNALELKGKYLGHTAPNVRDAVQDAIGGCLFLDEAYALAGDGHRTDSFSNEAVRTLLTEVENNRTNLLIVLAGYKDKMAHLMAADPGLPRRFPQALHLADYTPVELARIAASVAESRFDMKLADGVEELLSKHIELEHRDQIAQHNGGLAVNLVEAAIGKMAGRVVKAGAGAKIAANILAAEDFGIITIDDLDSQGPLSLEGLELAELEPSSSPSSSASSRRTGSPPADSTPPWRQSNEQSKLLEEIEALKRQLATEAEKRAKEEALRKTAEIALYVAAALNGPGAASLSPAVSPASSPDRDGTLCRARSAGPFLAGTTLRNPELVQAS